VREHGWGRWKRGPIPASHTFDCVIEVVRIDQFLNPALARLSRNFFLVLAQRRQLWSFERTVMTHVVGMAFRTARPYNRDYTLYAFQRP
jgi:hypothetical protein